MSLQLVGKENLPNVHIKEIELHKTQNTLTTKVNLHLYDFEVDGQMQWYNEEALRRNMKIMIVASRSTVFNDQIINGRGFLTPKDISLTEGYSRKDVKHKMFSIAAINKKAFDNEQDGLFTFPYRASFQMSRDTDNLAVFAVCYLDTQQYSIENSIDLQSLRSRNYHGAIVGENVLVNGVVPKDANLLTGPDSFHIGPVHYHNNGFMDGSKHSSVPHQRLNITTVRNTKIKDYSLPLISKPRVRKYRRSTSSIGDLWCSMGADGVLNGMFAVDMDMFLSKNSEYAYILKSLDKNLYSSLLDSIFFDKVTIYKQLVKTSKRTNKAGTNEQHVKISNSPVLTLIDTRQDKDSNVLQKNNKYSNPYRRRGVPVYSSIKRKSQNGLPFVSSVSELTDTASSTSHKRIICFQDAEHKRIKYGEYQYSVEISFKDPAREYLEHLHIRSSQAVSELKNYRNRVLRPINYNYYTSTTTANLTNNTPDSTWIDILQNFLQLYNLMFRLKEEDKQMLYNKLVVFLHPKTVTAKSIEWFYNTYTYLITRYKKYFNIGNNSFNTDVKRGYVQSDKIDTYSKITKKFNKTVDFSQYKGTMSFIPKSIGANMDTPFPFLSYSNIRKMASLEKQKYYSSDPSFNKTTMQTLTDRQVSSLNNTRYNSCTYFSPASIVDQVVGEINTNKVENIELNKFNKDVNKAGQNSKSAKDSQKHTRRKKEFITKQRKSFHIKPHLKQTQDNIEYKDSVIVLGNESKFSNEYSRESKIEHIKVSQDVQDKFSTYNILKEEDTNTKKSDFVMDNEDSILSKILKSNKSESSKEKMIRSIPMQIKSLIGSEYGFAKNNILHSQQDLFVNSATKNLIETCFLTLVKIEYLSHYSYSCKPVWKELNDYTLSSLIMRSNKTVLCRMVPVRDSKLSLDSSLFDKLSIQNEYFYLGRGPESISVPSKAAIDLSTNEDFGADFAASFSGVANIPLNYSKTIIIMQPALKDGPLSSVDYGIAQTTSAPVGQPRATDIRNVSTTPRTNTNENNRSNQSAPAQTTGRRAPQRPTPTGGGSRGGY